MLGCEIRVCSAFTLHTVTSGEIPFGIARSNDPNATRVQNLGRQWLRRTAQAGTKDDLWDFNEKNEPMAQALILPNTFSSIPFPRVKNT